MRELTTADRVSNVQSALFLAEGKVYSYVFQEIGTAGYEALKGIIPALIASLAFVTLTTAVGAGAGAAVGSLGFGVGAVPLGIAGGALGFKTGLWILNLVGLAFLIEHMGSSLQEAVRHIESGLVRAWGPRSATDRFFSRDGDVEKAANDIALGIAVIIRCILEGVVLYLTAKGISKLPELVANLKRSKLGEGFAIWVEQNYQQLLNNPRLTIRTGTGAAAKKPTKIIDHTNVPEQPRPVEKKELGKSKLLKTLSRDEVKQYYKDLGWSDRKIDEHIRGIDFSKPITVEKVPKGTTLQQWIDPDRGIGNYFTQPGTPATKVGVEQANRTSELFVATEDVAAMKSTAAPINDTWSVPGESFQTEGGGIQYFIKNPYVFKK